MCEHLGRLSRSSIIVLLALGATFAGFVLASNAERLRGDDSDVTPSVSAAARASAGLVARMPSETGIPYRRKSSLP